MGILVKNRQNEILFRKTNIPEYSRRLVTWTLNSDSYKYHSPLCKQAIFRHYNFKDQALKHCPRF